VNETVSGLCLMDGFVTSGVEHSGSTTTGR